ncbi:hypothetical protein G7Y89_g3226 [Cudoniella acicularis]|uniref:Uncharacterized protein n=1 Tax=Cudoniella acicularis TaxID=354080 RepID=A0A8H4RT22_9HELO|nr:hypothetical protein G7Y89_g3226 [Cudoniella acicularis]
MSERPQQKEVTTSEIAQNKVGSDCNAGGSSENGQTQAFVMSWHDEDSHLDFWRPEARAYSGILDPKLGLLVAT